MKNKIVAVITALGGLCALCCVVPVMSFMGLGTLEAFFCDSPWAIGVGVGMMTVGFGHLAFKYWKGFCAKRANAARCSVDCGCKLA